MFIEFSNYGGFVGTYIKCLELNKPSHSSVFCLINAWMTLLWMRTNFDENVKKAYSRSRPNRVKNVLEKHVNQMAKWKHFGVKCFFCICFLVEASGKTRWYSNVCAHRVVNVLIKFYYVHYSRVLQELSQSFWR